MRRLLILILILTTGAAHLGQELQHEAVTINIEVPVRVFDGDRFVDTLTMEDFEVTEDGTLQEIAAVYLVKKTEIQREESELPKDRARQVFSPQVARHFVLLFEIQEYLPRLGEAVKYFFEKVIQPGDTLSVVTPLKTYHFKDEAFAAMPKTAIAEQLISKLKKDTKIANAEYWSLSREIEDLILGQGIFSAGAGGAEMIALKDMILRLEQLRYVEEENLRAFADYLRAKEGQKNVFLFYQKEVLPQMSPQALTDETSGNPDENPGVLFDLMDLYEFYKRDITFDVEMIQRLFADSSITVHFLYLTRISSRELDVQRMTSLTDAGIQYVEKSEDIFSAFNQVAVATGGYTTSSVNASDAFQKAVEASENYYLLYYRPQAYRADGSFRTITVRVKGKKYRILHRSGYLAD
jgi:VWFA-related protein